jgi:sialate O-acetylesterase
MPSRLVRCTLAFAALLSIPPACAQSNGQAGTPLLHAMFQDHAVLQRDKPIKLWGKAAPGDEVRVALAGNSATVRAASDGSWRAELPALPAGGPYDLTVAAPGNSQTVRDMLVGDVWLCSGQSNMEFPVSYGLNAAGEIGSANDPQIRLMTIEHDSAPTPRTDFKSPVSWQPVTPASVRDFSAACYFMARELRMSQKVPFGLIDATWGGTAINPWRSELSLAADPAARDGIALLRTYLADPAKAAAEWGASWGEWWRSRSGDAAGHEPWRGDAPGNWRQVPAFNFWEGWGVPELAGYNGMLWYRTEVTLTAKQAAQAATLTLGVIDDLDMSFVNDTPVGTTNSWDALRSYAIKPGTFRPGANRITVGVVDTYGPGGMHGDGDKRGIRFADGSSIALPEAARWTWRVTPAVGDLPHAPWETIAGMAGIYNGMVAPIGQYGLRGVAWYQGESDAGNPRNYAGRLASLMSGWRTQFGDPKLPFLIVQLAGWGARNAAPVESGFASIRDEQRRAVEIDARAALISAIDLGDVTDIHPANKQDVGRRLARAADGLVYGGTKPYAGPWPTNATRTGGDIRVTFARFDGGLVTYSASGPIGFELCGADAGSCRFVAARIEGDTAILPASGGPSNRVRFCWGDSPVCNLYDRAGLPAVAFEMAVD